VFEEVGEAGSVWFFVFGAYVIEYGDGHDGGGVVFVQDDVESVRECVLYEVDFVQLCLQEVAGEQHQQGCDELLFHDLHFR
jgi:hypothetical protein